MPTWTAVDVGNLKTCRELWEYMKMEGWNVDVSKASFDVKSHCSFCDVVSSVHKADSHCFYRSMLTITSPGYLLLQVDL